MRRLVHLSAFVTFIFLTLIILPATATSSEVKEEALAHSSAQVQLNASSKNEVSISYELTDLQFNLINTENEEFSRISLDREPDIGPNGFPELPSVRRYVLVPPQSGIDVEIDNLKSRLVQNYNPYPRQVILEDDEQNRAQKLDTRPLYRAAEAQEIEGFWPPEIVEIGKPAIMRGHRIVPITINPMRWNPQTSELEVIENVDFHLDFDTDVNRTNIVRNPDRPRPSQSVRKLVEQLVMNPMDMPERDMGVRDGAVLYVTGTGNVWEPVIEEVERLVEWRRRMGWTAEILECPNTRNTGAVKEEIQEFYDNAEIPPELVVIVGDTDGQFPIACYDHGTGAWPYESDHDYTELEGDDHLSEFAIGRFPFDTIGKIRNIVDKIIIYESDPHLGEGDQANWRESAAVFAGDERSGLSSIDCCKWIKEILVRNDYDPDNIAELYWEPGIPRPPGLNWIHAQFRRGINFYVYRGWTFMNGFHHRESSNVRNDNMLPFVLLPTCNTGDYGEHVSNPEYYPEILLNFNARRGAIGAIGAAGATHTAYNNLYTSGVFRTIFGERVALQGWSHYGGKLDLYQNYFDRGDIDHEENNGVEAWLMEFWIFNLMGDPATELFTKTPSPIEVEHAATLRPFETDYMVRVLDDDNEPLENVRVCLYESEVFQEVLYTDDEGYTRFALDPEWTEDGEIMLTVTGHNLIPYLEDVPVRDVDFFLGASEFAIDDDEEGESNGDDDGTANPTERIELTVSLMNFGAERPDGAVGAVLTAGLPNLEVIQGEDGLDEAPAPGESGDLNFVIEIGGGFPDEQVAVFRLATTVGEETWNSSVRIPLEGPEFVLHELSWDDDPIAPAQVADLHIEIENIGSKNSTALHAELISFTNTIDVPVFEGEYPAVGAGDHENCREPFRLAANLFHLGGSLAELGLIVSNEAGFVDTVFISFPVDRAQDGQPFGPDEYGYICLDNTDVDWFSAPEYEWIEIDRHYRDRDFDGIDTELSDRVEEGDESVLIDLPFEFQYYGQAFNEVTICTNGWMAMGDCHELITAKNRIIPAGMNPPGMLAPFWDDLLTDDDNGGIYYYYDEDNHLFIVEWSGMERLVPAGNGATETFQVILYDPEHYPTITGDGDIVFQYRQVEDEFDCYRRWDVPYASVGICSPDQGDGLQYTYWNELSDGAAELVPERAIKFTTTILASTGSVFGVVADAATGDPVEGASVTTEHGFVAMSDENGEYRIEYAPADIEFFITITKQGYNELVVEDILVEEDEDLEMNFELLHPEFRLDVDAIEAEALEGEQTEVDFTLTNDGNGPLSWYAEVHNPGNADADPWEQRRGMMMSEITGDSRIQGVVFANGNFYVAGAADREPTLMYVVTPDGEVIDQYPQHGVDDRYGYRDLAWDGELIWGSGGETIFAFTPEGDLVSEFEGPYNPNNNFAWDPDDGVLWVSSTTTDITAIDREGNEIRSIDRQGLRVYGLAYWPYDPDGYCLYLFHKEADIGEFLITKVNTETGEMEFVRNLEPEVNDGRAQGAYISNEFDYFSWVFLAVVNDAADDRIDIWQLDSRRDWAILDPIQGTLEPEAEQELTITFDASNMPAVELPGELHFYHNADDGHHVIDLTFEIIAENADREQVINLAEGWNMMSINVVPPMELWDGEDAEGPDVISMLERLRIDEDNHHIQIFKDQNGNFYVPEHNFNNIPFWNLHQGYQALLDENVQVTWTGQPIPADAPIPLRESWNMVAYYPEYELDASAPDFYVLSNIVDNVGIAKDVYGNFLLPDFGFSNMEPWRPGQGYLIQTVDFPDEGLNLVYPPENGEEINVISMVEDEKVQSPVVRTSENMSVLITSFGNLPVSEGDQIVARSSEGDVIGSGTVHNRMAGLAVWGDDNATDNKDGLSSGESFELLLVKENNASSIKLNAAEILKGNGLVYETNGFTVLEASAAVTTPSDFFLSEAYPNPFNSVVRLNYGMPEAADVNISIFDLHGREVDVLQSGQLKAGYHTAVWNAGTKPSGLYWVRMESQNFSKVRKVMLVK